MFPRPLHTISLADSGEPEDARRSHGAGRAGRNRQACLSLGLRYLKENDMLKWALIFAIVAIIAGILGFGGIAGTAAGIAKFLFGLAVVIFLIFLALGVFAAKKIT